MRVLRKMSFDALMGNVSREEMKSVLAGSGEVLNGSGYTQSTGGVGGGYSSFSNAMTAVGYQTVSSFYTGLQATNIPGTAMYVPQQNYNNSNGWGSSLAAVNQYNYNNNYSTNQYNSSSGTSTNNTGWVSGTNGSLKTNDPAAIRRLMGLVNSNGANNLDAGNGLNEFLKNETTAAGRTKNDTIYGGWLKEVVIINNYHGPSTIPKGLVYANGSLQVEMGVMMGSGGVMMGSGGSYNIKNTTPTWFGIPIHGSAAKPTTLEAAYLAKDVYGGTSSVDSEKLNGWSVSKVKTGITYNNSASGFKSQLYEKTVNGKKQYCYVTAGTDASITDVVEDVFQVAGIAVQYKQSVENAKALKKLFGDSLSFAGHSLGGGMAEANARATGESATTFNAAGLSPATALFFGLGIISDTNAYIMVSDPLNVLQTASPILPSAGGQKHFLDCASSSGATNGHSINSVIESIIKYHIL